MIVIRRQPVYNPYATLWLNQPNAACCNSSNNDETKPTIDKKPQDGTSAGHVFRKKLEHDSPTVIQNRHFQVTEDNRNFSISIDLPGVKFDDVNVDLEDVCLLRVYAERKSGDKVISKYHQRFSLDEESVDASNLHATLSDGVLTIDAPKKEVPKPITVAVVAEDAPEDTENSKDLRLSLDAPGVKLESLKVFFLKGTLVFDGERKKGRCKSQLRRGFSVDSKTFDVTKFQAFLADGVLTITVPHKEALPSKSIVIASSPGSSQDEGQEKAEPKANQDFEMEAETREEEEIIVEMPEEEQVRAETVEEEDEEAEEEYLVVE